MNVAEIARRRHACKAFDPARKIPPEQIDQLRTLLQYSPSSVNGQPWHFILAASEAGKERLTKATDPEYSYNSGKIRSASHVFVLCARTAMDDDYVNALLAREIADGRLSSPEAQTNQQKTRSHYVNLHRENADVQPWMERQVYLALGSLLFGAAALQIDACPIEGFDRIRLDEALDLPARGFTASVIVALGYRGENDFNAALPKSRWPQDRLITEI